MHSNYPQKPNPAGLIYAIEQIESTPMNPLYIGNHDMDIEFGQNAGCRTALVDRGENEFTKEPDILIKSFLELI